LNNTSILAVALIVAGVVLMITFSVPSKFRSRTLRMVPAYRRLRRAIGLAVEDGKRLHVSLGNASVLSPNSASALVGLSALERIAQMSVISDRPPVATSGDGTLAVLSQDTLQAAYRGSNALEQYDSDRGRLVGTNPMAYAVGTIPVVRKEQISTNILVGDYGPEVGLICEAAENSKTFTMAVSNSLPAQAVMYATADEPLIGEELFGIPAYLGAGIFHFASLRVQDILRWVIIGLLVLGAVLKFLGVNFL
jgi:hypothetical protein